MSLIINNSTAAFKSLTLTVSLGKHYYTTVPSLVEYIFIGSFSAYS